VTTIPVCHEPRHGGDFLVKNIPGCSFGFIASKQPRSHKCSQRDTRFVEFRSFPNFCCPCCLYFEELLRFVDHRVVGQRDPCGYGQRRIQLLPRPPGY
jgi:hypothetical protein